MAAVAVRAEPMRVRMIHSLSERPHRDCADGYQRGKHHNSRSHAIPPCLLATVYAFLERWSRNHEPRRANAPGRFFGPIRSVAVLRDQVPPPVARSTAVIVTRRLSRNVARTLVSRPVIPRRRDIAVPRGPILGNAMPRAALVAPGPVTIPKVEPESIEVPPRVLRLRAGSREEERRRECGGSKNGFQDRILSCSSELSIIISQIL
jgi:hypothetical protein